MREKGITLNVEQTFRPVVTCSFNQGFLVENSLNNAPQKKCIWNKRDKISAQEVEIINPDYLEVVSLPEKKNRMERPNTLYKIKTRSTSVRWVAAARNRVV